MKVHYLYHAADQSMPWSSFCIRRVVSRYFFFLSSRCMMCGCILWCCFSTQKTPRITTIFSRDAISSKRTREHRVCTCMNTSCIYIYIIRYGWSILMNEVATLLIYWLILCRYNGLPGARDRSPPEKLFEPSPRLNVHTNSGCSYSRRYWFCYPWLNCISIRCWRLFPRSRNTAGAAPTPSRTNPERRASWPTRPWSSSRASATF